MRKKAIAKSVLIEASTVRRRAGDSPANTKGNRPSNKRARSGDVSSSSRIEAIDNCIVRGSKARSAFGLCGSEVNAVRARAFN